MKDLPVEKVNIAEKLESFGYAADSMLAYVCCDLSRPDTYGETVLCALSDYLCVIGEDGSFFSKNYSEVTDIYAENYVSSGGIILRCGEEELMLSYFTLGVSAKLSGLSTSFASFQQGRFRIIWKPRFPSLQNFPI